MKAKQKQAKLSQSKTALPRIYRIDREIAAGKYPNSQDLARLCETSVSTISRDVAFMRDQLLAPVAYDGFRRGYYYETKTFRLPAGFAGADNLLALNMAKNILSLYKETPLYEASNNLLESILAPIASDGNSQWLEKRIIVPKIASAKIDPPIWEIVVESLKKNLVITFEYLGVMDEDYKIRRVRPYQLLFDSGVWYLFGYAEERKAVRVFSLSRIKNASLTKDVFFLPKDFSYDDLARGSYFGVFIGHERFHFSINCYKDSVFYAAERQWAENQKITKIKDGVRIEFTSTQFDKVLRWVLSCGCTAVPQKPKKLVDEWKKHITALRKMAAK
jgi:predicted DNA-binding transcriptional regulator YafY